MNLKSRKIISIALVFFMMLTILPLAPVTAHAASSDQLTSMTINGTPYYAEALDTTINPSNASAWTWDAGNLYLRNYNGSDIVFQAKSATVDYAVNVYVQGNCTINGNLETNVQVTSDLGDVTRAALHIHLAHGASLTVTGQIKGYEVLISGPSNNPAEGAKGILDVKGGIVGWNDLHITGYTPVKIAGDVKALIGNGSNAYGIEGRSVTVESPAYALIQGSTYALGDQSWINVNAEDYTVETSEKRVEAMPKVSIKDLKEIKVTSQPSKTEYFIGDDFVSDGMVVTAYYDDGTSKVLSSSDYTLKNHEDMPKGIGPNYLHEVQIVYTEDGVTEDIGVQVKIEKSAGALESIQITTEPTKMKYRVGSTFDPAGMVVTAYYANGTSSPVTDYILTGHTNMSADEGLVNNQHAVRVSYTENEVTKTRDVLVTVKDTWPLDSIAITKAPDKTTYAAGDNFDPTGMVVIATYEDGFTRELTASEYDYSDGYNLTKGTTKVTISYYDSVNFIERYADQAITVGESGGETTVYTVSVSADPAVGGSVIGAGSYYENASVTVTATANEGYHFVNWTEDGAQVSTEATYSFTAANRTLVAVFEADVPASSITGIAINPTSAEVTKGQTQQFNAAVTGTGEFDNGVKWSVSGGTASTINANGLLTVGADETAETLTVTVKSAADNTKTATATVTVKPVSVVNYSVIFDYNDGTTPTTTLIPHGKVVSEPVAPSREGFIFKGWFLGETKYDFAKPVEEGFTLTAKWEAKKPSSSSGGGFSGVYNYPVIVGDTDGADVAVSEDYAVKGEEITVTVKPDAGEQVDEVIVTDKDGKVIPVTKTGDNKYTFTMPASKVTVDVLTEAADYGLRIVMQINNKNILVNGKTMVNDVAPVIVGDRTLVPIRVVTELLGGSADWDNDTRTVTLKIDGKTMNMTIGKPIPGFGTSAVIMNDRTYVPVRYVMEKLGAEVEWIGATQQIIIEK